MSEFKPGDRVFSEQYGKGTVVAPHPDDDFNWYSQDTRVRYDTFAGYEGDSEFEDYHYADSNDLTPLGDDDE